MDNILVSGHDDSDVLLQGLNYNSDPTSSYVLATRQARWSPEAGNRFDGVGSRILRFKIGDPLYLEPSSLRLTFVVNNTAGANLEPTAPVQCTFSRYRLFFGSTLIEELDNIRGAPTAMIDSLKPAERRLTDSIMGHFLTVAAAPDAPGYGDSYATIPANASRRVTMSLPLGICDQMRWLPLMLTGALVLELELAPPTTAFAQDTWEMSGPYLLGDVHEVDAALQSEYSRHVLAGGNLQLSCKSISCTRHVATAASFTVNLSRAFTRLCQVFVIPKRAADVRAVQSYNPIQAAAPTTANDTLKAQLVVGARRFPETKIDSIGECWLRLQQAAGTFFGAAGLGIKPADYKSNRFVLGFNLEKTGHQDASLSGLNTRNGATVTLELEGTGLAAGDSVIVVCVYDQIVSIKDGVVDVYQ